MREGSKQAYANNIILTARKTPEEPIANPCNQNIPVQDQNRLVGCPPRGCRQATRLVVHQDHFVEAYHKDQYYNLLVSAIPSHKKVLPENLWLSKLNIK